MYLYDDLVVMPFWKKNNTEISKHKAFEHTGGLLHRKLLLPIALLAVFYTVVNILLGLDFQAYLAISVVPAAMAAYWLDNVGFRLFSQVWIFLVVILVIFFIGIVAPKDTYIYLFYFPIALGAMIIFQGRKKWIAYIISLLCFVIIMSLLLAEKNDWLLRRAAMGNIEIERMTNAIGVFIFVLLEVRYLMRMNELQQSDLMDKQVKLDQSVERLKSSLYVRERMMSILAHDVRAPLASIHSFLELLENEALDKEDNKQMIHMLRAQAGNTSRLVDDVVRWAGSQLDTLSYNPAEMSIDELKGILMSVCRVFEMPYEKKELVYIVEGDDQVKFKADRNMLEAILRNLISNAIKFTGENRHIEVNIAAKEKAVYFAVVDNGVGISPENLNKLRNGISFTTTTDSRLKGIGLGNQIVMDFLHKHHAELSVASTEGHGSVFSFELPTV